MDGDEMTRVIWKMIKDELLCPFIDLKTEYYDLGLEYRNKTNDQVTVDSAEATKKYGVAVKCATITPNAARMTEYNLKEMWKSPNGTIRAILDGTVFRAPILVKGVEPYVKNWVKPITIARHAYGDIYKNTELKVAQGSKAELVVTDKDGKETRALIHDFKNSDVDKSMLNFPFQIESNGTMQLFCLMGPIVDALEHGYTVMIDEFGTFIHSDIAKWIIRQFRNAANPNKAQLIVNTQDQSLLSLELLRRDQIWFTQKNIDTGASELYSLSDFNGVRADIDLQKSYSVDKFGAKPFVSNEDVMI